MGVYASASPPTVSNYLQSTAQSIFDAATVMVIFLSIIGTVWYLSAHPAVQDAVRAGRLLHGTVDILKASLSLSACLPLCLCLHSGSLGEGAISSHTHTHAAPLAL